MKKALVLIDIQNMYFTEGRRRLFKPEETADRAADLLKEFREKGLPIIHVRHMFDCDGFEDEREYLCQINERVAPIGNEHVIEKSFPSAFLETKLKEMLDGLGVDTLVVVGMMTHMCVDTTVRNAANFNYDVILIDDACTGPALEYKGELIPASTVHGAFMAAIDGTFAKVMTAEEYRTGCE